MRILLTNDDGVHAPGILALYGALTGIHDVRVAAPETEQSAVGHAITLADPIRVRHLRRSEQMEGHAVGGTPADCVKLAVAELLPEPPELVVSGINQGANVGVNIIYSGTVSAATEAAILGLPSVAFSYNSHTDRDFSQAARVARRVVELFPEFGLPPGVSLNVNIPALPLSEIKGFRWTRQSTARFMERFIRRTDPRGHVYYWLAGETVGNPGDSGEDHSALNAGYITLTPIRHDLTDAEDLARLNTLKSDIDLL